MADTSTELVAYDQTLFPKLLDQDPEAVTARFAQRFLTAGSVDELFDVLKGQTSRDMIGRRLQLLDVAWAPFESDRGIVPLAICNATDIETGEVLEFATTSMALTMFIRRCELIDALPVNVRITSKKTRGGNDALNFERP